MSARQDQFALGSFSVGDGPRFLGLVDGEKVYRVADLLPQPAAADPSLYDLLQNWGASFTALQAAFAARQPEAPFLVHQLRAHAPVPEARQLFCTGANYRKHVIEMVMVMDLPETQGMNSAEKRTYGEAYVEKQLAESEPYVFMKPVTSIAGPDDSLLLPDHSQMVDWELELVAVIGRDCFRAAREDALDCVAGYMIGNDLTARDRVRRTDAGAISPDWIAAKGGPGFLPTGPLFVPAEFVADPHDLGMQLSVNGELMQDDRTSDMTFDIPRQIAYISRFARLIPGDLLCTGSPAGNGIGRGIFLKDGDVMEARIEGLGRQRVRCVGGGA
ncbi:fumarylacetoacetate hydrolase family protein [Sphingobium chungangianum]